MTIRTMRSGLFLIVICCTVKSALSHVVFNEEAINSISHALSLQKYIGNLTDGHPAPNQFSYKERHPDWESLLKKLEDNYSHLSLSRSCVSGFMTLFVGLAEGQPWAISVIDSFGKPAAGITKLNLKWPGAYSMCISATGEVNINESITSFTGKYCWLNLSPHNATSVLSSGAIQTGICIPNTCSDQEINEATQIIEDLVPFVTNLFNVSVKCVSDQNFSSDTRAIVVVTLIFIFLTLLAVATVFDVWVRYFEKVTPTEESKIAEAEARIVLNSSIEGIDAVAYTEPYYAESDDEPIIPRVKIEKKKINKSMARDIVLAFSVYSNAEKILDLSPGKERLSCINGIRFLSMTWVILGHSFMSVGTESDNIVDVLQELNTFPVQTIVQGTFSVDSFFVMSGLLLTYLFLKEYEKTDGKISWVKFYVHRYFRLSIVYFAVLFLLLPTFIYWGSGPFWQDLETDFCRKYWWRNVIYLNNFWNSSEMCMGHTWYLANDMQFYVISPIILIFLAKKWQIGMGITWMLLLASFITTGLISAHYNLTGSMFDVLHLETLNVSMEQIYIKPYCRIGPYLIGMVCGWLLYKTKCRANISKPFVVLGWAAAIACNMSVIYGLYHNPLSKDVAAFYTAVSRSAWGLGLCWVIFACCCGYGGIVDKILSWPVWNPFSRVTYCAYLWHLYLIYAVLNGQEEQPHYSRPLMFLYYVGNVVMSYAGAFVLSITFEAPFLSLEKALLKK